MISRSLPTFLGSYFGWEQPEKGLFACVTVFSDYQRPNFCQQLYYLIHFKGIMRLNLSLHCTARFTKKKILLLPTKYEIRDFLVCHISIRCPYPFVGAYKSSLYLATNLYTSVVDFIYFRHLVEEALLLGTVLCDCVSLGDG